MKRILAALLLLIGLPAAAQGVPAFCRPDGASPPAVWGFCTPGQSYLSRATAGAPGDYVGGTVKLWEAIAATEAVYVCTDLTMWGKAGACPAGWLPAPKEQFILKSQITAATVKYVVTWTPAALNTDGTPVQTPAQVLIQFSNATTFPAASTLSVTAAATTRNAVVDAPPGALYWRAATRDAAGTQSEWTTPLVQTDKQFVASTTPACWPAPVGDAASATIPYIDLKLGGGAAYWACKQADGTWKDHGFYGAYKPSCIADAATAALGDAASAATKFATTWAACIDVGNPADVTYQPLYAALASKYRPASAPPPPPPSTYAVAPYTLATRPSYPSANGVRGSSSNGRVLVGAPCDCNAVKIGNPPGLYCSVAGQENTLTAAVDQLPVGTVAVCALR